MSICSKCGSATRYNQRYCNACHAEWMRANRPAYKELTPEQKKKNCARSYVKVYVRRGKIIKQPCSNCGAVKAERHHENYDKPLEVIWLCRPCHIKLHKVLRETFKQTA